MDWFWVSIYHATAMFWEVLWALVFGFTISGLPLQSSSFSIFELLNAVAIGAFPASKEVENEDDDEDEDDWGSTLYRAKHVQS